MPSSINKRDDLLMGACKCGDVAFTKSAEIMSKPLAIAFMKPLTPAEVLLPMMADSACFRHAFTTRERDD